MLSYKLSEGFKRDAFQIFVLLLFPKGKVNPFYFPVHPFRGWDYKRQGAKI